MRKYIVKPLLLFTVLIVMYSILLTIVFIPSSNRLAVHIDSAIEIIYEEGVYRAPVIAYAGITSETERDAAGEMSQEINSFGDWMHVWHGYSGENRLDNTTDMEMLNKGGGGGVSPFENAFSGYARYWHGYLVFLRPMLSLFDYGTIRYISVFHLTLLIIGVAVMLAKKLKTSYSLLLGIVLSMCAYNIFPYSLQFSSVFYVMLYAMLLILLIDRRFSCNDGWLICFFLTIGSITNFLDFLTAPLLTLGVPLTICYALRNKCGEHSFWSNTRYVCLCSAYWGAGYALTWVAKWVISSFVSTRGIMNDIAGTIGLRMFGNEEWPLNRVAMLASNIIRMYPIVLMISIILIVLALSLLIMLKGKPRVYIRNTSPILLLCAYPYVWYMVFANHSQVHGFFTYRAQAVAVFALGAFLLGCFPDNLSISGRFPCWISRVCGSKELPGGHDERTD